MTGDSGRRRCTRSRAGRGNGRTIGAVELIDEIDLVRTWTARLGGRYMGADRADEYAARNGVPGELLVKLSPTKVISAVDVAD